MEKSILISKPDYDVDNTECNLSPYREWISPAVATYLLREVVENDQDHPQLTEHLDWSVVEK